MSRITIGRDSHSDVRVDERWDTVSNRHGEIVCEDEKLTFIDHSSNGTVINGQKIQNTSVGIYPGDSILLANAFELDWKVIERFFPELQRPTVTRNVRGEGQNIGRRTVQMSVGEEASKGRKTEAFNAQNMARKTERFDNNNIQEQHDERQSSVYDNYGQANEYSQSEIDQELEKWNWGAFFCSWLWGAFNGIFWPLFVLIVAAIPYIGQVCSLCLSVYLGVNGSKMAWRTGKFSNFESFKKAQRNWAVGGIILFVLGIIANIYALNYTLSLF